MNASTLQTTGISRAQPGRSPYRPRCEGCLERRIQRRDSEQVQYCHRQVTLLLLAAEGAQPLRLLLDAEPQQPGEDEMATALRFGGFWRRIHGPLMSCWPTLFTPAPAL